MADFTGKVIIYADGGCENNGMDNAMAYGSFVLQAIRDGQVVKEHRSGRVDYPQYNTNNAAEVQIFIDALTYLLNQAETATVSYPVEYHTDSKLVVNWLRATFRVKASHLIPLVEEARQRAKAFPNLTIQQVRREEIVRILGH